MIRKLPDIELGIAFRDRSLQAQEIINQHPTLLGETWTNNVTPLRGGSRVSKLEPLSDSEGMHAELPGRRVTGSSATGAACFSAKCRQTSDKT